MDSAGILDKLAPISLEEMSSIRLMNRVDNKFITTSEQLECLLQRTIGLYRVQKIGETEISPYHTVYLDTPGCDMYLAHHNGRAVREKIRIRTYETSKLTFLEIKNKDNKGRTDKQRIKIDEQHHLNTMVARSFLKKYGRYSLAEIRPTLESEFDRITLINNGLTERLTIDQNLCFHNLSTGESVKMPRLVVIELKRDGFIWSPISDILRQMHIRSFGFSKYCMGSVLTNEELKQNNFKQKIILMNKLLNQ